MSAAFSNKHVATYFICACACAAASLKTRESSVKRNAALIKRLRALSEDTCQAVLEDIDKVNQSKVPHLHLLLCCATFCRLEYELVLNQHHCHKLLVGASAPLGSLFVCLRWLTNPKD